MPRDLVDNERGTAINPGEAVEEKVSLSDRFGLWLGFHHCGQDEYLAMIDGYAGYYELKIGAEELRRRALAWAMGRGARSGRVAWQFIQDLAGELGQRLGLLTDSAYVMAQRSVGHRQMRSTKFDQLACGRSHCSLVGTGQARP